MLTILNTFSGEERRQLPNGVSSRAEQKQTERFWEQDEGHVEPIVSDEASCHLLPPTASNSAQSDEPILKKHRTRPDLR